MASAVLGALALAVAIIAFQHERFAVIDAHPQAVVLALLDDWGAVRSPDVTQAASWREAGLPAVNDANAFAFLRLHGWWFGGWALVLALWGERRGEETLPLSIGMVLGAFALLFLGGAAWGLGALLGGGTGVAILRSRCGRGRPRA